MVINCITLAIIGIIDFTIYKIPNVILAGWLMTNYILYKINSSTPISPESILFSIVVVGIYFPLRLVVKNCSAGDFKLFTALVLLHSVVDSLILMEIIMLISLYPLVSGIKKIPMGVSAFLGYITFLLLKNGEII